MTDPQNSPAPPPQPASGYDTNPYQSTGISQAPERGLSVASLVLGILSLFFGFTVVVPIVGLVLGAMGLRREPEGRTFALVGVWINGAILFLGLVVIVIVIVALSIGIFSIPGFIEMSNAAVLNA
ncbi:DUF4190 domain-containing protein [Marisediminicola antarctica]|uniref:DUF4190 domain-containing protein n=1 Tax=Marisediminicola antarctica TaxID=674079 RepID=A0A7L5AKD6_9MICO|nr:DUF4190 domain-containing protein [Marisediminicola antarctica]QHO68769.1 hypothetical protein BHD05_03060 [Marisediminicola antarctica]